MTQRHTACVGLFLRLVELTSHPQVEEAPLDATNVGGWMINLTICAFLGASILVEIAHFVREAQLHDRVNPSAELTGTSRFGL